MDLRLVLSKARARRLLDRGGLGAGAHPCAREGSAGAHGLLLVDHGPQPGSQHRLPGGKASQCRDGLLANEALRALRGLCALPLRLASRLSKRARDGGMDAANAAGCAAGGREALVLSSLAHLKAETPRRRGFVCNDDAVPRVAWLGKRDKFLLRSACRTWAGCLCWAREPQCQPQSTLEGLRLSVSLFIYNI